MLDAIEWYAPSFEIVDCHLADWKFQSAESAADFALHWRLIVGTPCEIREADKGQARRCAARLSR